MGASCSCFEKESDNKSKTFHLRIPSNLVKHHPDIIEDMHAKNGITKEDDKEQVSDIFEHPSRLDAKEELTNCTVGKKTSDYVIEGNWEDQSKIMLKKLVRSMKSYVLKKQFVKTREELANEQKIHILMIKTKYFGDSLRKIEESYPGCLNLIKVKIFKHTVYSEFLTMKKGDKLLFYSGYINYNLKPHGKGVLLDPDGIIYNGEWNNNEFTGPGKLIDKEGCLYEGNFKKFLLFGEGTIRSLNGVYYRGQIENNLKNGKGIEETLEYVYEGSFLRNKKDGMGKIKYLLLNDCYEGQFQEDQITGSGLYTWGNQDCYEGTFINGKMHGKGSYRWPDGNVYEGEYINNIKEGKGTFKWKNGNIYKGPFVNGVPHGKGKLCSKTGEIAEVEFCNGKLQNIYE